jgi:hypothetical protein
MSLSVRMSYLRIQHLHWVFLLQTISLLQICKQNTSKSQAQALLPTDNQKVLNRSTKRGMLNQSGSRFGKESTHKYVCIHRRTSYTRQRSRAPPSFAPLPHYKWSSHLRATDDQGPCFPTQNTIIHSSHITINPGNTLIHKNKKKKRVPHTHEVPSSILGLSTCFVLFRFVLLLQYTTLKGVVSYNSS